MKNGTTVICTNIFKGKTEEEIKKRFNICIAKIIQRESLAYSEIGQITQIDNSMIILNCKQTTFHRPKGGWTNAN